MLHINDTVTFDSNKLQLFIGNTVLVPKYRTEVMKHVNSVGIITNTGFSIVTVKYGSTIINIGRNYLIKL